MEEYRWLCLTCERHPSSYNRFTVFLTRAPYEKLVILLWMWDNERNRQRAQYLLLGAWLRKKELRLCPYG
jgi:hypothetical protein